MKYGKLFFFFMFLGFCQSNLMAQSCVTLQPENPSYSEVVTITFNAAAGSKGLKDYTGAVYMHSGLITANSLSPTDWKYQVGNWGTSDKPALMKKTGPNTYEKKIIIKDYYGVPETEEIKLITFVFRDETGNLLGKTELEEDIFVRVNRVPAAKKENNGNK
jgi:hypothetical protein